jgi:type III pantothenate kinase
MLLAIDIGNTNITFGAWDGQTWQHQWRIVTESEGTADAYEAALTALVKKVGIGWNFDSAVMSSVVPPLTEVFKEVARRNLVSTILQVRANLDLGIDLRVDSPEAVGADRIANAVAAFRLYPGPSLVVDMGTATKFDVISAEGALVGGAIAAGLQLSADALFERAAKLNPVALEAPAHIIGRNTVDAVQSGLVFGYVCLIEGMVGRMLAEHPNRGESINLLGTGGLIGLVAKHTKIFNRVDPFLTLSGLRLIFDRVTG